MNCVSVQRQSQERSLDHFSHLPQSWAWAHSVGGQDSIVLNSNLGVKCTWIGDPSVRYQICVSFGLNHNGCIFGLSLGASQNIARLQSCPLVVSTPWGAGNSTPGDGRHRMNLLWLPKSEFLPSVNPIIQSSSMYTDTVHIIINLLHFTCKFYLIIRTLVSVHGSLPSLPVLKPSAMDNPLGWPYPLLV